MRNSGILFFLKKFSFALFLVLLLPLFSPLYLNKAQGASVYDSLVWVERSIDLTRTGCTTQSFTPERLFTEVLIPKSQIGYTAELQTVYDSGNWGISKQYYQASPIVYKVFWHPTTQITTNWTINTTYAYLGASGLRQANVTLDSSCSPVLSGYSSTTFTLISSSQTLSPSTDRASLAYFGSGVLVGAYPTGYAGISLVPYNMATTTSGGGGGISETFNETVEATMSIISSEADTAVKLGLFLGAVHFLYQWLMSVLMSRKVEQK